MKFDFWTFLFQIVNFVVLLFILKRLLFKPIREIMEKRRKTISDALGEAGDMKKEAERLKGELNEELRRQKKVRKEVEAEMRTEVDEERVRLIECARKDAERVIEKERALYEMEKRKFENDLTKHAADMVSDYAVRMLRDVADEELHRGILRKFHDGVKDMAADIAGAMHGDGPLSFTVVSAFPLSDDETVSIRKGLETSLDNTINVTFETDAALIAGIMIRVDDRVYDFSLQGQIRTLKEKLGGTNSWQT
jgi:F-type H+-transporting ATPase subunit b